jgi:serine/threonine-protein kinase
MADAMLDTTVGGYRITAKLSVGGMGAVYKGEHNLIGKVAAIKVLHPNLRSNREIVDRFFREAKATTSIKHPGIVEIYDFGYLPSGDGYITMELLEGMSLAQRLASGEQLPESEAAAILRGVCSALAAAHAKGIIHRDLKPDNIFLCPDPDSPLGIRTKLLDFGIAKLSDPDADAPVSTTRTGALMGTPTYMSPEQCRGAGAVDLRSDLYSIGCIFYETLCGRPPFCNIAAGEMIASHLFMEPPKPRSLNPDIAPESEQLIQELLTKDPMNRLQTATEAGRRFAAIAQLHGFSITTNPIGHARISLGVIGEDGAATAPTYASESKPMPTTLSSVASESMFEPRRSRKRVWFGLGAIALAAGIGLTSLLMSGGTDATAPTRPASQPAHETSIVEPPQPVAIPGPAAQPAQPATTDPVPAAGTMPAPEPHEEDAPTAGTPERASEPNRAGTASTAAKPPTSATASPATTRPTVTSTKPTATMATSTATAKPTTSTTTGSTAKPTTQTTPQTTTQPATTNQDPPKTGSASKPRILIETDL